MSIQIAILTFLLFLTATVHDSSGAETPGASAPAPFELKALPSLPDREGLAGSFAGTSGGALLVAGGANFPQKKPWEGGTKTWSADVFVLEQPNGVWKTAGKLERPLGYGVSVATKDGLVCVGGSDATKHYADCFLLQWKDDRLVRQPMPPLPKPCANMCGALVGNVIYVAGGMESPSATNALKTFWALDLQLRPLRWETLPSWRGTERMLAVAGATADAFYLFSGASLQAGTNGKPVRTHLHDAFRYKRPTGWRRLSDLPRSAVAAPSPAPVFNDQLMVMSGDDGLLTNFEPMSQHPGFPRDVLAYDPRNDRWNTLGTSVLSRATAPIVEWQGHQVVVSGETRPGVRTPEVWLLQAK